MPLSLFRISLFMLLLWPLSFHSNAQDTVFYNLSSPYHTVYTHLQNLQTETYHPLVAGKSFDQEEISPEEAAELAVLLKQIWDGEGTFIPVDRLPQEPDYLDSLTGQYVFSIDPGHPEIFLKKLDQRWVYPPSTFEAIKRIHSKSLSFWCRSVGEPATQRDRQHTVF